MSRASAVVKYGPQIAKAAERALGGSKAASLLTRLGLPSGSSVQAVLNAARQNKVATLFILMEAGEVGGEVWQAMLEEDPTLVAFAQMMGASIDAMPEEPGAITLGELAKYKDEFALIDDVSRIVGGETALLKLHAVMNLPRQYLIARAQIRQMN